MPKLSKKVDRGPRDWYQKQSWRNQRRHQLQSEPLCQQCLKQGQITPATQVDHVEPHKGDLTKFRMGKLQSLCQQCHWRKTQAERGYRPRPWGYGLDGMPIPAPDWREDDQDFLEDEDLDEDASVQPRKVRS
jgi:hypothetical protein